MELIDSELLNLKHACCQHQRVAMTTNPARPNVYFKLLTLLKNIHLNMIFGNAACVFEQPSLNPEMPGDVVLLNRWSVRNHQVQRGDIVSVL